MHSREVRNQPGGGPSDRRSPQRRSDRSAIAAPTRATNRSGGPSTSSAVAVMIRDPASSSRCGRSTSRRDASAPEPRARPPRHHVKALIVLEDAQCRHVTERVLVGHQRQQVTAPSADWPVCLPRRTSGTPEGRCRRGRARPSRRLGGLWADECATDSRALSWLCGVRASAGRQCRGVSNERAVVEVHGLSASGMDAHLGDQRVERSPDGRGLR